MHKPMIFAPHDEYEDEGYWVDPAHIVAISRGERARLLLSTGETISTRVSDTDVINLMAMASVPFDA